MKSKLSVEEMEKLEKLIKKTISEFERNNKVKIKNRNKYPAEEILNYYKVFIDYHDFSGHDFNFILEKNEETFTLFVDTNYANELKNNNLWNLFMQRILCICVVNNFYVQIRQNQICKIGYDKTLQKESNTRKLKRDN